MQKRNTRRGFTLIELLVVVLIIGILAAVAVPQYQKAVWKSRFATVKHLAKSIANAEEIYYLANGQYTTNWSKLDISIEEQAECTQQSDNYSYCDFSWGKCDIDMSSGCTLYRNGTPYLLYKIMFNHISSWAVGQIQCIAFSTDTNDIPNRICKEETKSTAKSFGSVSEGYFGYIYK